MSFRGVIFGQRQATRFPLSSLYAKLVCWLEHHIYHKAHTLDCLFSYLILSKQFTHSIMFYGYHV